MVTYPPMKRGSSSPLFLAIGMMGLIAAGMVYYSMMQRATEQLGSTYVGKCVDVGYGVIGKATAIPNWSSEKGGPYLSFDKTMNATAHGLISVMVKGKLVDLPSDSLKLVQCPPGI